MDVCVVGLFVFGCVFDYGGVDGEVVGEVVGLVEYVDVGVVVDGDLFGVWLFCFG